MKAISIHPVHSGVNPTASLSITLCLILLTLLAAHGEAQTSLPGYTPPVKPKSELSLEEKTRRGLAPLSRIGAQINPQSARLRKLPALDPSEMRPERKSMRLRIGAIRQIKHPFDLQRDGSMFQTPEGKLYLMRVASEGAKMIRLRFSRVALPVGARLFVYSRANPDNYHALHVVGEDGWDMTGRHEFWTPPIMGDEIVVEYLAPDPPSGDPPFVIDLVSHIFIDPRRGRTAESVGQNGAAPCNLNVPTEWSEAAKSVGLFQFTTPKGEFACSGVLLNNSRNDGTPYFLTANHCLSRNDYSSSLRVYWLYDSGDFPTNQTPQTSGGVVIATSAAGDFTLLRLPSTPSGVHFAGWTTQQPEASTPVTSVHHPQASYKRFSTGQTVANTCPSSVPSACEHYTAVRWQNGITEPGSSGGPLFVGTPDDPRVAGLLSGGASSCDNRAGVDFYGRFDVAFAAIAPYLTGQDCAFALEPVKQAPGSRDLQTREIFNSVGGDGGVRLKVRTGSDCSWTAQSEAPWITLTSPASGSGEAIITYTVAPHTGAQPRSGYLSIAGHRLLISQMGVSDCPATAMNIGQSLNGSLNKNDCRSALDPRAYADRYTFAGQAGQQLVLLMYSPNIDTFLLLFGPDGKVVEYNDDHKFSSNSIIPAEGGFLELTASGVYTIEATSFEPEETGSYELNINRVCAFRFTPDPSPLLPASGGNGAFTVNAPPGCLWTAQTQESWLTINTTSGNGPAEISYSATANPTVAYDSAVLPRFGRIMFTTTGGHSYFYEIRQSYNCGFRLIPNSVTIKPSEVTYDTTASEIIALNTGNGCQWTATSNTSWLEFYRRGPSFTGADSQTITIKATSLKFGNAPRVGTMTIGGETLTVTVNPVGQLCPISSLTIGQTISDSLALNCRSILGVNSNVKQYKFQGRAGQRIAVVVSSPEFSLRIWLKRMDGDDGIFAARLTPQINFESASPGALRMPESGYITLPADGAYFLEVGPYNLPGAGSFVLSLLEAPVGACDFKVSATRQNLAANGGRGDIIINATGGDCAWTATTTAPWIKLATTTGNGGVLEYSVEPNTGAFRVGVIVIAGYHLIITQQPANALVVVSAADYAPNLAIRAIQAIFGAGLATQTLTANSLPLPTTLGGVQVLVTTDSGASYEAPLFFVSPNQINFQMPSGVPIGAVNVTVKVNEQTVGSTRAWHNIFAPALFTADASGRGVPAAYALRVRSDGTQTTEPIFDRDAAGRVIPRAIRLADNEQVYLILFGTGLNGAPFIGHEIEATFQPDITQKGIVLAAPGFTGLDQINLLLPLNLRGRGDVTLTVKREGVVSNPVTIRIGGQ